MRVVIIGAGEVGSHLCDILSEGEHDVTLIENRPDKAQRIDELYNVRVIEGDGCSAECLVQAGVDDCDFCLAMTDDDRINLIASHIAKTRGAKTTIARMHDQTFTENTLVNYQLLFGIDTMLNPEGLCAVELAKLIRNPGRVAVENFARGQIEVQQVKVSAQSKLINRTLVDLRLDNKVRIGYFKRGDEVEMAKADTRFQEGDLVTIFGDPEKLYETKARFEPARALDFVRVVLFGGGEIAISMIRLLSNQRFKIRIIDNDEKLCRWLADTFPHATIIHGDGTSLRLMEEEQIGEVDYFIACTKKDEDNIVTGMQAAKLGAKHVHIVANKPDYEEVLNQMKEPLGFELIVSPRIATVDEVMRYLSTDVSMELGSLTQGKVKILEFYIPVGSSAAGKSIREAGQQTGVVFVALQHKFQARVPGPDDKILEGDRIVAILKEEQEEALTLYLT